jgi:hypothetical protein
MSRRFTVAALALALAGGVYLSGGPAEASNMGFKLERDFHAVGPPATPAPFQGIYFFSAPLFNGLADIADTTNVDLDDNPCNGPGDGTVNADDALCDIWTSQQGQISMQRFIIPTCTFESRVLINDPFVGISGSGAFVSELVNPGQAYDDDGYQINVPYIAPAAGGPGDIANQAVIVGSHDPSYAGMTLALPASGCRPTTPYINLPYHSMYRFSTEIVCGLENVDWFDTTPADGFPDTCPNGIFDDWDGTAGGAFIQVVTYDNVPDGAGRDNSFITQNVTYDPFAGEYSWGGTEFALIPGDAYRVGLSPGHRPTLWLSPHF